MVSTFWPQVNSAAPDARGQGCVDVRFPVPACTALSPVSGRRVFVWLGATPSRGQAVLVRPVLCGGPFGWDGVTFKDASLRRKFWAGAADI